MTSLHVRKEPLLSPAVGEWMKASEGWSVESGGGAGFCQINSFNK